MNLPAVLLNSLFLSSMVRSGSMMDAIASAIRFAARLAAVSSAAAASMPLLFFGRASAAAPSLALAAPSAASGSPEASAAAFVAASSSAWRKSTTLFHLVATVSCSTRPTGDFEWRGAARSCK